MHVGDTCRLDDPWIADDDLRALLLRLDDTPRDNRVGIGRVIAENHDTFRILDLDDGIAHGTTAKRFFQRGDGRAMANACATVHIVRTDSGTRELLRNIIRLIARATCTATDENGIRTVLFADFHQFRTGETDRFFPGYRSKRLTPFVTDQRLCQARCQQTGIVQELPSVISFQTQFSLIREAVGAFRLDDPVVVDRKFDLAARSAIRANN